MKIDVLQQIRDYEGEPIGNMKDGASATVRDLIFGALNTQSPPSPQYPAGRFVLDKLHAYKVTIEVMNHNPATLTAEDIVLIKAGCDEVYMPLVRGRLEEILEGDEPDEKES